LIYTGFLNGEPFPSRPSDQMELTMDRTSCPGCGNAAEIQARDVLESTDGPIEHAKVSGPRGTRTHNPRIKSPLLCQLS
jgi:hypothetical protein